MHIVVYDKSESESHHYSLQSWSTDAVAVTSNCSFPYTYNGALYHSCIDDVANVSRDDETTACLADNSTTAIICDISPGSCRRPN